MTIMCPIILLKFSSFKKYTDSEIMYKIYSQNFDICKILRKISTLYKQASINA